MKKIDLIFTAILVPLDYVMIFIAGVAAYHLRIGRVIQEIRPVFYEINLNEYLIIIALVAVVFVLAFAISGLYAIRRRQGFMHEFGRIFIGCSAAMTIIIIVIFFQREYFSSRFIILFGWLFSFFFVSIGRGLVRWIQQILLKRGVGLRSVIMVGPDPVTEELARELHKNPTLGFRVIGRYETFSDDARKELVEKVDDHRVHEIIVGHRGLPNGEMLAIKEFADEHHIGFHYIAGLFEFQSPHVQLSTIADIPVVEVLRTRLDGWGKIWKRLFDIVLSFIGLVIISPLLLLTALLIKIDSQGTVIVRLERVGDKGEKFRLYKFRSMVMNAHSLKKELLKFNDRRDGPLFKIKDDPRVTRVGKVIRKLSLDEWPQLVNVLKGEMSLVGPRPHEPEEVGRYEKWQKKLLSIKPGMTGLAQISGRSELQFKEEARLDIYYIQNWSIGLDVRILIKTPWVVLSARSAS
ncbi:sugar transferase [Patescibacteria group bacterium]